MKECAEERKETLVSAWHETGGSRSEGIEKRMGAEGKTKEGEERKYFWGKKTMKKEGSMRAESSASIVTHQSKCGDGQKREMSRFKVYIFFLPSCFSNRKETFCFFCFKEERTRWEGSRCNNSPQTCNFSCPLKQRDSSRLLVLLSSILLTLCSVFQFSPSFVTDSFRVTGRTRDEKEAKQARVRGWGEEEHSRDFGWMRKKEEGEQKDEEDMEEVHSCERSRTWQKASFFLFLFPFFEERKEGRSFFNHFLLVPLLLVFVFYFLLFWNRDGREKEIGKGERKKFYDVKRRQRFLIRVVTMSQEKWRTMNEIKERERMREQKERRERQEEKRWNNAEGKENIWEWTAE